MGVDLLLADIGRVSVCQCDFEYYHSAVIEVMVVQHWKFSVATIVSGEAGAAQQLGWGVYGGEDARRQYVAECRQ